MQNEILTFFAMIHTSDLVTGDGKFAHPILLVYVVQTNGTVRIAD